MPRHGGVVWEIGCGHGHFLVRYASLFPQRFCIGVDTRLERLERSGRKRDRASLSNCHFVRAEAREFLHALPDGVILDEIWVLFPDPWPKSRHHKNRLLNADFLEAVAVRCREGSRLFFRTDHDDYFVDVAGHLAAAPHWRIDAETPWPVEIETVFQSRAPAYRSLSAVRTASPARAATPVAPGLPPRAAPTSPA